MTSKYIISEPYEVDVDSIKYDTSICKFNPPKTKEELAALTEQIRMNGQTQPAYFRNGLLGDGAHRAMVCKKLGIRLIAVDIDPNIPDEDYILLCNENTFTARNDTPTQAAIKALKLVENFGYSDAAAAKLVGLKDRRMVGYARSVKASKYNRELNILDTLLRGDVVHIANKHTRSLDTVKRIIARLEEEEAFSNEIEEEGEGKLKIDYDSLLTTERGRDLFWELYGTNEALDYNTKLRSIELINKAYGKGKND